MPSPRPLPAPRKRPALPALLALLLLAMACGGSGGGGGSGSNTGSVGLLLTDGPVDPGEFQNIFVTYKEIILIGGPGQVTIFRGERTIDLRDLEDVSKLAAVGRRVPAGIYEKIRLLVTQIKLVRAGTGEEIFPKLPPKLDFNPREPFTVKRGQMLYVQLDLDAGKSILLVEKGNGGFNVRPVAFVDVITGPFPGKLVLLEGRVERTDADEERFLLCGTHPVSRPDLDGRVTRDERDGRNPDDWEDFCVLVDGDDDTSYFDERSDPASFDDLRRGDTVAVLGRFERREDERLVFEPEIVQIGGVPRALDGVVRSEVDVDGRFTIELDPGQGVGTDDGLLLVELQEGGKVFRRRGEELDPEDLRVGDPVRVSGFLQTSNTVDDLFKATFVVVDVEAMETDRADGEIVAIEGGGARLELEDEDGNPLCVDVPSDAKVFEVRISDGEGSTDPIAREDLRVGDDVSAFGEQVGECLRAETLIAFVDATSAALGFGGGSVATATALSSPAGSIDEDPEAGDGEATAGGGSLVVIEPERRREGLIWVKLPEGDEAPAP